MPTYRLTKLVEVQRRSGEVNDFAVGGDYGLDPEKVGEVWAEIRPLSATERVVANQVSPTATYKAYIRRPEFTVGPEMWLTADGKRFEILGIVEIEDQYLELTLTTTDAEVRRETLR